MYMQDSSDISDLGAHGEAGHVENGAQHASTKPLLGA